MFPRWQQEHYKTNSRYGSMYTFQYSADKCFWHTSLAFTKIMASSMLLATIIAALSAWENNLVVKISLLLLYILTVVSASLVFLTRHDSFSFVGIRTHKQMISCQLFHECFTMRREICVIKRHIIIKIGHLWQLLERPVQFFSHLHLYNIKSKVMCRI